MQRMNAVSSPQRYLINVEQFHRMGEAGIFPPGARVELIEGELLSIAPVGSRHGSAVAVLNRLLMLSPLAQRTLLWPQNAVVLSAFSELQPDFLLLRPRADHYRDANPEPGDVLLLIEVSDSTLGFDRRRKVPLYARHGIVEAWIVNLPDRQLEVFREPRDGAYATVAVHGAQERVACAAFPDCAIAWGEAIG
jgi:Uma2 family endonuclease